ncbi:MAG TPA: hypothetical protein VK254_03550 [Candidatus Bathyarchaeia archaeon]|nr:hypothetical protein [Candidatus Bathyarchaeia archaeon]
MKISRTKFIILFLILAFVFMFISNALFGTEARVFPWHEKSFLGTDSPIAWKSAGYHISFPIKVVLIGPFALVNIFYDDPPPPFVAAVFALYWSILASILYYFIDKLKRS